MPIAIPDYHLLPMLQSTSSAFLKVWPTDHLQQNHSGVLLKIFILNHPTALKQTSGCRVQDSMSLTSYPSGSCEHSSVRNTTLDYVFCLPGFPRNFSEMALFLKADVLSSRTHTVMVKPTLLSHQGRSHSQRGKNSTEINHSYEEKTQVSGFH